MPLVDVARWTSFTLVAALLLIAAISDILNRRIPNLIIVALIFVSAGWFVLAPLSLLWSGLAAGSLALAVTVALYLFGIVGAGDAKLFSVVALFCGLERLPTLACATALVGGAVAIVYLLIHPTQALRGLTHRTLGRRDRGIPYGVSVAVAGIAVVFFAASTPQPAQRVTASMLKAEFPVKAAR